MHAAIIKALIKRGDRVRHLEYGLVTVVKVQKSGAIWVCTDDGLTGTTSIHSLRKVKGLDTR